MSNFEVRIIEEDAPTYYTSLGITKERAYELMLLAADLQALDPNIPSKLKKAAAECKHINEVVFVVYKMGEIAGMDVADGRMLQLNMRELFKSASKVLGVKREWGDKFEEQQEMLKQNGEMDR